MTADRQANQQTQDTLTYLSLISDRTDHRIVVGQYAASAGCCSPEEIADEGFKTNIDSFVAASGHTPGMVGVDYNDYDRLHPKESVDYDRLNSYVMRYAQAGSLIAIGYHAKNPWTGGPWNDGRCPGAFTV